MAVAIKEFSSGVIKQNTRTVYELSVEIIANCIVFFNEKREFSSLKGVNCNLEIVYSAS